MRRAARKRCTKRAGVTDMSDAGDAADAMARLMSLFATLPASLPSFLGSLRDIEDARAIFGLVHAGQCCVRDVRLRSAERDAIAPGVGIVYESKLSGIRRWTDGHMWGDSTNPRCFQVYKEAAIVDNGNGKGIKVRCAACTGSARLMPTAGRPMQQVRVGGLRKKIACDPTPGSSLRLVYYYRDRRVHAAIDPCGGQLGALTRVRGAQHAVHAAARDLPEDRCTRAGLACDSSRLCCEHDLDSGTGVDLSDAQASAEHEQFRLLCKNTQPRLALCGTVIGVRRGAAGPTRERRGAAIVTALAGLYRQRDRW